MSVNKYNGTELINIAGKGQSITVDSALSDTSTNPVQNKVIKTALDEKDTAISNVAQKVSNNDDAYSSTKAYAVGDLVIYDNKLYRCTTACSAGSWATNQSCFTADTLVNVTNTLNDALSNYLEFRDVSLGAITIGARGFVDIASFRPTIPGKNLIFASIFDYGDTSTKDGGIMVNCNGRYLSGQADTSINRIVVRYFFI